MPPELWCLFVARIVKGIDGYNLFYILVEMLCEFSLRTSSKLNDFNTFNRTSTTSISFQISCEPVKSFLNKKINIKYYCYNKDFIENCFYI